MFTNKFSVVPVASRFLCARKPFISSSNCVQTHSSVAKLLQERAMLDGNQLKFYRENGYIVLNDVYSHDEIDKCSREYDALFDSKKNSDLEATWKGNWTNNYEKGQSPTSVLSIHSLQNHSATFTKMLLNDNLLDTVEQILGTGDILLHHTKAHNKPPGIGSPFPMHQDYQYFPYKNDSLIAVFINLDDSDKENGGLAVYPGSHLLGPQPDMSSSPRWHFVDQEKFPIEKALPLTAKQGQVVIFSYLLVHGSYPNVSDRVRRMLLFQEWCYEDGIQTPKRQ